MKGLIIHIIEKNSPIGINGEYIAEYIDSIGRRGGPKNSIYCTHEGKMQKENYSSGDR